jgi:ornithine cyclodeaminase/alanine dehydrogenase-like protein (mu-crystallin family)
MSPPDQIPYLSPAHLERLAMSTRDVVGSIEHLIRGQSAGTVWAAAKSTLSPPDGRYIMSTLAAADDPPVVGSKLLVLNLRNSARGLPDLNSLVTLLDSDTGVPLAVVDGNWVTALRTAGLSAIAARRMARPDSAVVAFIGCGLQARSHLHAMCDLFPLREIHAFGRGTANRDALCRAAEARGLRTVASTSARAAVEAADIVVSSVSVSPYQPPPPFMDARWLKPGAFVAFVDLAGVWLQEGMAALDRIVIDDMAQEATMAKKLVDPALVTGDLAMLVSGAVAGRASAAERSGFAFRGMALGDLAVAALAYRKAVEAGDISLPSSVAN